MGKNDTFTVQSPLVADVILFSQVLDIVLIVAISCCGQIFGGHDFNYGFDFWSPTKTMPMPMSMSMSMMVIQGCALIYSLIVAMRLVNPSSSREVCTVRILPHGVQIEEYTLQMKGNMNGEGKKSGLKVRFIPREWIMDVIVKEHVMSYRVTSVVLFRIIRNDAHDEQKKHGKIIINDGSKESESSPCRTKKSNIKDASLVTAFNPKKVEMSYEECMQAWSWIRDAL